jgi:hypothetical protein
VGILEYLTAQPLISRIAQAGEELVRLASVDGERLTLVAKAQGARSGLLYDPDVGLDLRLSCSAAGQAWLMTLPEERAIACVTHQGLGEPRHYGPKAPTGIKALLKVLAKNRKRGFSIIQNAYAPGSEFDGGAGAQGGGPDHRGARDRRAVGAPDAQAHAAAGPCPRAHRRRAVHVRGRIAAPEIRHRGHLGQRGGERVRRTR